MNPRILQIAGELKRRLEPLYGERLQKVVVFGSYVRGEETDESDLDVAIVLDPKYDDLTEWNLAGSLFVEIDLAFDVVVDTHIISLEEYNDRDYAILRAIHSEGVTV
ncbi:MAG: nucleotidyltransferase domain-containing protein [bacterium]|nr:nucleotidyltransferase domain-containing protein [bacterium]